MLKVALTGNIASGKSSVAEVWREQGALVIEADQLTRQAVEPGTPALGRIVERWGQGILLPSGELDRAALRDVVFRDPDERRWLEEIIHPEVGRLRREAYRRAELKGVTIIVSDIPLLFEVGLEEEFEVIVLVDAPEDVRRRRLVRNRGISEEEAERMIGSQWPAERKRPRADFVIDNDGSASALRVRAREVWSALLLRVAAWGEDA